ncbi:uncharacterized protein FIBRA_07956 [Fibroporia radiculosa]|uniref:DUF5127 domain-containing protein n=1 Tax=Fibroporia radiculosa TaxID=599839 RepID=J4H4X0_9APHY|nr:uncharacterized protein FIBRA_07956 [Fibroporia radiculosa]CCM05724.1 predicted protein [Fibroporia radiculosa]
MFRGLLHLLTVPSFLSVLAYGSTSLQTFWPAAVPLAVRSPYLSAWQSTTKGINVTSEWSRFWPNHGLLLGWTGHIRVDSTTYRWLGNDTWSTAGNLAGIEVTPTRTIYNVQAGPMDVTITFLSPIEPSDWVRQSIPFSYMAVNASSNDGLAHSVQLYSDITAEWVSGNRSALVNWSTATTDQSVYHKIELTSPTAFEEIQNQANDGVAYYSMTMGPHVTYQTGSAPTVRTQFQQQGSLQNTNDTDFRIIGPADQPVFAISVNLGSIQATQSSVVWAIGYVRDPSIKYTTSSGQTQLRSPYYRTQYSSVQDIISEFLSDYSNAETRAEDLDNQLMQASSSISNEYSQIVSLAARQTFGSIDITVANGTDGNWNTSDVMIFMKNMGIDGRVNPVEIMYASFPLFLYLNASFGKPLLAPLFEYQDSPQTALPYAMSDLGGSYPIASGENGTSSESESSWGIERKIWKYAHHDSGSCEADWRWFTDWPTLWPP